MIQNQLLKYQNLKVIQIPHHLTFSKQFRKQANSEEEEKVPRARKKLGGTNIRNPVEEVAKDDQDNIQQNFRSAAEYLYPDSVGERKFQSKFRTRLEATLLKHHGLMEDLVKPTGFTIVELRFSADKKYGYILWDCYDDKKEQAEQKLYRWGSQMRDILFRRLGIKRLPIINFIHDSLKPKEQHTQTLLQQVINERQEHENRRKEMMSKSMEEIAKERNRKQ
eukprot:TRINITY_DN60811_c0_g1_i1.p1 TRINITY_DN60811_c0_g1~~TRINITY_DN60811_c0_g1_i1.p1  ORF type:complete len:222 (-),score=15.61 TRINITY_DN60811_c0_g1_i1:647-1312(-)